MKFGLLEVLNHAPANVREVAVLATDEGFKKTRRQLNLAS